MRIYVNDKRAIIWHNGNKIEIEYSSIRKASLNFGYPLPVHRNVFVEYINGVEKWTPFLKLNSSIRAGRQNISDCLQDVYDLEFGR